MTSLPGSNPHLRNITEGAVSRGAGPCSGDDLAFQSCGLLISGAAKMLYSSLLDCR